MWCLNYRNVPSIQVNCSGLATQSQRSSLLLILLSTHLPLHVSCSCQVGVTGQKILRPTLKDQEFEGIRILLIGNGLPRMNNLNPLAQESEDFLFCLLLHLLA